MSLWADIDTYLATELLAEMGAGGLYTTLITKQVLVDDLMGPDEAEKLSSYPVVFVRSREVKEKTGQHGNGRVNIENTYKYVVIAVAISNGQRQAKQDAQELRRRLREFLRTRLSLGGLTSGDNEYVQKVVWGGSFLEMKPLTEGNNVFCSVAYTLFEVESI